jgi:hypothetical protein
MWMGSRSQELRSILPNCVLSAVMPELLIGREKHITPVT